MKDGSNFLSLNNMQYSMIPKAEKEYYFK